MKTISFPADKAEEFKSMLKMTIGAAPESGYSIQEVRTAIKVMDKVDAIGDKISLEDAEYQFTASRINQVQWRVATPAILEFVDCISAAT